MRLRSKHQGLASLMIRFPPFVPVPSRLSRIFYGKVGEISTNRMEDQEMAVLSLHLLQNCLVYINTLMFQNVLSEKKWFDQMAQEDFRAMTPLIYTHVVKRK